MSQPGRLPAPQLTPSLRSVVLPPMLLALLDQYTDEVDRAADEIGAFFDHLRQVGVRSFVAEHLDDADYHSPRAQKAKRQG